jgi:predicted dehydrogenase
MARIHCKAYRELAALQPDLPRVDLAIIADRVPSLAEQGARAYGFNEWTADWRRVLENDAIDLVDIVTPNDVHAEIAIAAAEAGKAIFCEKPLAGTLSDAQAMADAVAARGVLNQVAFVYRSWPAVQLARQLIDAGRLGTVRSFRGHFFHDYALSVREPRSWRFDRSRSGGGSLADIGSHVIDLARYLVGEIDEILATSATLVAERPNPADPSRLLPVDVDDRTDALVRFAGGARGSIATSWVETGYKTDIGFELHGDRGAVHFSWEHANVLRFYDHTDSATEQGFKAIVVGPDMPGARTFYPVAGLGLGFADGFAVAIASLLRSIARGEPCTPDFAEALACAHVVAAAQMSATTDRWVRVR